MESFFKNHKSYKYILITLCTIMLITFTVEIVNGVFFQIWKPLIPLLMAILFFVIILAVLVVVLFKFDRLNFAPITIVFIAFACPLYLYLFNGYRETSITKFSLEYIAVIFSGASFIFVISTLILQRKQLNDQEKQLNHSNAIAEQMYDAEVMRTINEFLSDDMKTYRDQCSDLRDKLRFNKDETIQGLSFAFERQIRDDYFKNKEWISFKDKEIYKEYAAFTRLVRYFDIISHYNLSNHTARAIHFYYVWWRGFIKEVEVVFKDTFNKIPEKDRHLSFMPNWVHMIKRLDDKLAQHSDCPLN